MVNSIEIQGRIDGLIRTVSVDDGLSSDFILFHGGSRFQVICDSRIAYGFHPDDSVFVTGKIKETGGDVYISAESIVLDTQMEMLF